MSSILTQEGNLCSGGVGGLFPVKGTAVSGDFGSSDGALGGSSDGIIFLSLVSICCSWISCGFKGRSMLMALRVLPRAVSLTTEGWLKCFLASATLTLKALGLRRRGCLGEAGVSCASWDGVGRFGVRIGLGVLASLEEDEELRRCKRNRLFSSSEQLSSMSALSLLVLSSAAASDPAS